MAFAGRDITEGRVERGVAAVSGNALHGITESGRGEWDNRVVEEDRRYSRNTDPIRFWCSDQSIAPIWLRCGEGSQTNDAASSECPPHPPNG